MKVVLVFLFGIYLLPFNMAAQQLTLAKKECDLGKIKADTGWINDTLRFTNTDTRYTLTITDVATTCSCIKVNWPKNSIPPKGKGMIVVSTNITGKKGPFLKRITITSNDYSGTTDVVVKGYLE